MMSCKNLKCNALVKGPGMADVNEVTAKTLHGNDYARTPDDIVKNIVGKKK